MNRWIDLPNNVLPDNWFGPLQSALASIGMAGVVLIAAVLVAVRLAWLASACARAASRAIEAGALRPGAVILHGRTESELEDESAIATVTVTQAGSEQRFKGGWRHQWREDARKTTARPFVLVLASGERVRVDADSESVQVHAPLERIEVRTKHIRDRIASVAAGTDVYVSGALERSVDASATGRDYRSAGESLVLRAPARDALVIATESPALRFRRRARVHACIAAALVLLGIALHATVLARFDRLLVAGRVETVTLTWPTVETDFGWSGRGRFAVSHFMANGLLGTGVGEMRSVHGEVNGETYDTVMRACSASIQQHDDSLALMPFLVASGAPEFYLPGTRNGLAPRSLWIVVASVIAALIAYDITRRRMTAWFEGKRVDDSGGGRL